MTITKPDNTEIRLNKYIATHFGVSRREADILIQDHRVLVNNHYAEIGQRIVESDEVIIDGRKVDAKKFTYIKFYKPENYVCSRKKQGDADTIYNILPKDFSELKSVGRLDKNSSGLLILTNDGDFTFQMTHPSFAKTKIYEVTIDRELASLHQQMICDFGVKLNDGVSKLGLMRLNDDNRREWQVWMSEGRNRQIRRTFDALGYKVEKLKRINFGPYSLEDMTPGEWRKLKP